MYKKIIIKLLPFVLILSVFLFNLYYYDNLRNKKCLLIQNNNFNCVVIKKIVVLKDHNRKEIHCRDFISDSVFFISPLVVNPPSLFFDKVEVGDTLTKDKNSNLFFIANINKRDSFIFSCED